MVEPQKKAVGREKGPAQASEHTILQTHPAACQRRQESDAPPKTTCIHTDLSQLTAFTSVLHRRAPGLAQTLMKTEAQTAFRRSSGSHTRARLVFPGLTSLRIHRLLIPKSNHKQSSPDRLGMTRPLATEMIFLKSNSNVACLNPKQNQSTMNETFLIPGVARHRGVHLGRREMD